MKNLLLTVGIISITACVLAMLYAALNRLVYYNLMDAEGDKYIKLHRRMVVSFSLGLAFAVIGIACLFIRTKI